MNVYPKKYEQLFKDILAKEPFSKEEALELIIYHDFSNELTETNIFMSLKKFPLPKMKNVYERYPEFKECNKSQYVHNINLYVTSINDKINSFNQKKEDSDLNILNNLLKSLNKYINLRENNK